MTDPSGNARAGDFERQLRDMNEALLVSSVRQHELTEIAQRAEAAAANEIAERKQAESLIQCQKASLELLVNGEPIERVLDFLARSMESQSQGKFLVAIHLMEADGHHFGYVAAPSLPARYAQATRGMDARLELGACSSAVVAHEPTVVRDFAVETRWPAFTAEMLSLGLHGCFTTPIVSVPDQRTLGTFAIYYREPGDPGAHDQQLVDLVTHTVALAIDRKQIEQALRESEERFRTLADDISQFAWIADAKGWINWYNRRWYDYTGTTLEEMQGWGWMKVHHPDHVDRVVERLQRSWDTGEPWEDTFPLRGKDGNYRWFLSRALPIRDEQGNVLALVRHQHRRHRPARDGEPDRAAGRATGGRITPQGRVPGHARATSCATRWPPSARRSISCACTSAAARTRSSSGPARSSSARSATSPSWSATCWKSRASSAAEIHLNLAPLDLGQVVKHAVETATPLIEQHKHELVLHLCDEPLWTNADSTRMEEVLINLLNNAAKYTPDGGRIEVWCEIAPGDRFVQVRVRDNGMGIDEKLLPLIFDLFTQADRSLARSRRGPGHRAVAVRIGWSNCTAGPS